MSTSGSSNNNSNHEFRKGDEIEVLRNAGDGDVPVWFPATVINSPPTSGTLHVKFTTLFTDQSDDRKRKRKKVKDYVNVTGGNTRPVPPPEPHRRFVIGEEVEAFHEKGWRRGKVKDVLKDFKYRVMIGGVLQVVVKKSRVRVCRDWKQDDGSWLPSSPLDQHQKMSSQFDSQSKKVIKLRIICSSINTSSTATFHKGTLVEVKNDKKEGYDRKTPIFSEGTRVEVKSDEEGYHGSWYAATVVGSVGKGQLLVKYDTLTTDDGLQPLVEMAHGSNIRPLPPIINRMDRFKMIEEVDAWYNDGWWVGLVSKVLVGLKYAVYFWTTNEEYEFDHSKLRPHQEFNNQKWVASFLTPKLSVKPPRLEKVKIQTDGRTLMAGVLRGLKVEIAHGEKGYVTTWYPAVILGPVHNGKYLVEYRTLKTDKGRELVKEEVDVLCIRPCPPIIQRAHQFQLNDSVDAWDVIGWRCGQIFDHRTVKDSTAYAVYFRVTDTVAEFQHADLRPSQDFIDGTWFSATGIP